jgi:hypothetical protein
MDVKPTGEVHPAAELFPLMGDEELQALVADIKANGLRQPLVLDAEGRLLDGRNRLAACKVAKATPEYVAVDGDDPLAVVISMNVTRRHLSKAQRAIAAAEAWDLPKSTQGKGRGRAAALGEMFGVSAAYVQRARALVERDSALAALVKNGMTSLNDAYEALTEREAVLSRLQAMTEDTASLETLSAPGIAAITAEEKKAAQQRMNKQRDEEGLKQWEAVLAVCNTASKAVRDDLPPFPEGPEEELLRLAAREQARLLEDAAARLAQETDQAATLRRVK